jgi:hypothetical protein
MARERAGTREQRWVLALTSVASLMVSLDNQVVATALPAIRVHLHASLGALEWTVNAYVLSFAVLLMTGAAVPAATELAYMRASPAARTGLGPRADRRSGRSHPGMPVALRHDRWSRPPREIRPTCAAARISASIRWGVQNEVICSSPGMAMASTRQGPVPTRKMGRTGNNQVHHRTLTRGRW